MVLFFKLSNIQNIFLYQYCGTLFYIMKIQMYQYSGAFFCNNKTINKP